MERVVYDLAEGLKDAGEKVTVACPTESKLPKGVEHLDIGPAKYTVQQDWVQAEKNAYDKYHQYLDQFEIIHDHTWFAWPYIAKQENKFLKIIHTHHGHINWKSPPPVPKANLVGLSQFMASVYARQLGIGTRFVYNGVSLEDYPFNPDRGERLVYVGRIARFKQPHVAIQVAKQSGVPIDVIGGDQFVDDPSYVFYVKHECDGHRAAYVGEVQPNQKLEYLQKSRATLICSQMGEPFGLVAVETLATGRPVICLDDGALNEIVQRPVGFVCGSADEMADTIRRGLDLKIAPVDCRRRAEEFSREKMAENYLKLYKDVLAGLEW